MKVACKPSRCFFLYLCLLLAQTAASVESKYTGFVSGHGDLVPAFFSKLAPLLGPARVAIRCRDSKKKPFHFSALEFNRPQVHSPSF